MHLSEDKHGKGCEGSSKSTEGRVQFELDQVVSEKTQTQTYFIDPRLGNLQFYSNSKNNNNKKN